MGYGYFDLDWLLRIDGLLVFVEIGFTGAILNRIVDVKEASDLVGTIRWLVDELAGPIYEGNGSPRGIRAKAFHILTLGMNILEQLRRVSAWVLFNDMDNFLRFIQNTFKLAY